jgi:hypothetical protein
MASESDFLKLVLPLNNEFQDIWDEPLNENLEKIDTWAKSTDDEIKAARGNAASLDERLSESLDDDGNLLPATEVIASRNSFLYGDEGGSPVTDFLLADRLDEGDKDVFQAREGLPSLRDSLGARAYLQGGVLDGPKDGNGFATWLGFTAADAQIDGTSQDIEFLIGGRLQRIRALRQVTISGPAETYFLYAQYEPDGRLIVDGDSSTPPPASGQGTIGSDGSKLRIFEDLTVDFTAEDVEIGDILRIVADPQGSVGDYIIEEIAPGSNVNRLRIRGIFKGQASSSVDYEVRNPWSPSLGFDAAITPADGKLYIGEVDFDGAAITAVRALHFKDVYVGDWRSVDVSGGSPTFEEIWDHNLLSQELEVIIQVSQANDGSEHVEQLSLSGLNNTLGVGISNTLAYNQGSFNPGTSDASYTDGTLTGAVSGNLTGDLNPSKSAIMKATNSQIFVKNVGNGIFYTDYDGAAQQTGFIRVIVRKRV